MAEPNGGTTAECRGAGAVEGAHYGAVEGAHYGAVEGALQTNCRRCRRALPELGDSLICRGCRSFLRLEGGYVKVGNVLLHRCRRVEQDGLS
jgi:hypothetical protein